MKIKRFEDISEGVRDKMTPKSKEDMKKSIDTLIDNISKMTPWGMMGKIQDIENDYDDKYQGISDMVDIPKLLEISDKRIKESEKELDEIFESLTKDDDLKRLIAKVNEWIKKYGGNAENMESYGFNGMAEQIWDNGIQWRHDVELIYDDTVFKSFRQLLKDVAICETKYNNTNYDRT